MGGDTRDTQVFCFPSAERRAEFCQELGVRSCQAGDGRWWWGQWRLGRRGGQGWRLWGYGLWGPLLFSQTSISTFPLLSFLLQRPSPFSLPCGERCRIQLWGVGLLDSSQRPPQVWGTRILCSPLEKDLLCDSPPTKFFDSHSCPLSQ